MENKCNNCGRFMEGWEIEGNESNPDGYWGYTCYNPKCVMKEDK